MPFHPVSFDSGLAAFDASGAVESYLDRPSVFYIPATEAFSAYELGSLGIVIAANPDLEVFRVMTGHVIMDAHRYFHFRFIPVPTVLNVNNPAYNVDIPFRLWNTFPHPDELVSGSFVNTAVVTTDLTVGADIRDFEWVEYNIRISAGETVIDGDLLGTYTQGSFILAILGILIVDMPLIPEEDASEVWTWKTAVTSSHNNTEQRVRLAPGPVREVEFTYQTDETEMIEIARRLYQSTTGLLTVPYYQYSTKLTADSLSGSNEIFFNPNYTNFRVGDSLYIRDPADYGLASGIIQVVESLTPTGCIIEGNLGGTIKAGWAVCPAFPMYIQEPTQNFNSVSGTFRLSGRAVDRSRPLLRDGAVATLTTFRDAPVITQRTLAGITEGPLTSLEIFDSGFGAYRRLSSWPYSQFQRAVRYMCPIKKDMLEFDRWMLFFDTVAGAHKHFYLPSWLNDLVVADQPVNTGNSFAVEGSNYSSLYKDNPTYQQIEVRFADGSLLYYQVVGAVTNGDGNDVLTVSPSFPDTVEDIPIAKVSFLYKVRMATDNVDVKFKNNRAYFSFAVVGTST